jgi:hypothetical protein
MRIFLDTNVLASAVAARGLCADVVREILVSHQLIISESLLNELRNVLRNKLAVPDEFIDFLLRDNPSSTFSHLPGIHPRLDRGSIRGKRMNILKTMLYPGLCVTSMTRPVTTKYEKVFLSGLLW